jgi:hypothetical protein
MLLYLEALRVSFLYDRDVGALSLFEKLHLRSFSVYEFPHRKVLGALLEGSANTLEYLHMGNTNRNSKHDREFMSIGKKFIHLKTLYAQLSVLADMHNAGMLPSRLDDLTVGIDEGTAHWDVLSSLIINKLSLGRINLKCASDSDSTISCNELALRACEQSEYLEGLLARVTNVHTIKIDAIQVNQLSNAQHISFTLPAKRLVLQCLQSTTILSFICKLLLEKCSSLEHLTIGHCLDDDNYDIRTVFTPWSLARIPSVATLDFDNVTMDMIIWINLLLLFPNVTHARLHECTVRDPMSEQTFAQMLYEQASKVKISSLLEYNDMISDLEANVITRDRTIQCGGSGTGYSLIFHQLLSYEGCFTD